MKKRKKDDPAEDAAMIEGWYADAYGEEPEDEGEEDLNDEL